MKRGCRICGGLPIGGVEACLNSRRESPSHEHETALYCKRHLVVSALLLQLTGQLRAVVAPEELHVPLMRAGVDYGRVATAQEVAITLA